MINCDVCGSSNCNAEACGEIRGIRESRQSFVFTLVSEAPSRPQGGPCSTGNLCVAPSWNRNERSWNYSSCFNVVWGMPDYGAAVACEVSNIHLRPTLVPGAMEAA